MEEQMAQKSSELEQYLQRVKELEAMYARLEEALEDEKQARLDEEAMRKLQARSGPCPTHTHTHSTVIQAHTPLPLSPIAILAWKLDMHNHASLCCVLCFVCCVTHLDYWRRSRRSGPSWSRFTCSSSGSCPRPRLRSRSWRASSWPRSGPCRPPCCSWRAWRGRGRARWPSTRYPPPPRGPVNHSCATTRTM